MRPGKYETLPSDGRRIPAAQQSASMPTCALAARANTVRRIGNQDFAGLQQQARTGRAFEIDMTKGGGAPLPDAFRQRFTVGSGS